MSAEYSDGCRMIFPVVIRMSDGYLQLPPIPLPMLQRKSQHRVIGILTEEEKDAEDCAEAPGQLDNHRHLEMRRLVDRVWCLKV